MQSNVSLNQVYKKYLTFRVYPIIKSIYNTFSTFCLTKNFTKITNTELIIKGRRYDASIILYFIDFKNKTVCELGARDSILGSYLTQYADKVAMSDYFQEWEGLGDKIFWDKIWYSAASEANKLETSTQNILSLDYDDETFDVVIALSVLNYLYTEDIDGDIKGFKEMLRICKKGGIVALSIIIGYNSGLDSGMFVYTSQMLFDKFINYSNQCEIVGEYDLDLGNKYNDGLFGLQTMSPVADCIIFIKKL